MAQAGYIHQEFPKWVEKDGKRFVVQSEAEFLQHFPEAPAPVETIDVAVPPDEPPAQEGNQLLDVPEAPAPARPKRGK